MTAVADFDHFFNIFKSCMKVSFQSQNGILESYLVVLNEFWKFEIESKFCQNVKIFMTAVTSEISDFDHFLNILKTHMKVSFEFQNGILESYLVVLNEVWKFEIESKFCQNVKFFMTAVISKSSNFDYFLNILKTDMKVSFESLNVSLESYLVGLDDVWKFQIESKFVKIWNFSWPRRSLAKFQILTTFSTFTSLVWK